MNAQVEEMLSKDLLVEATRGYSIVGSQALEELADVFELDVDTMGAYYHSELSDGKMLPPMVLKGGKKSAAILATERE